MPPVYVSAVVRRLVEQRPTQRRLTSENASERGGRMENLVLFIKRALQLSVIVISVGTALTGCGGGGSDSAAGSAVARDAASTADSVNPQVVSLNATYRGQNYKQWVVSFWQWALAIPLPPASPLPHPFQDCNNRPISVGQTGNVWYWSAPDEAPLRCDQRATI